MTKDEALKLALEALEQYAEYEGETRAANEAITAIKEALAQPEQEPVVWMYQNKSTHEVRFQKHMRSFVDHGAWYEVPLYSEPLANQEKTSGSPKPAKPEALRLADAMEYDLDWCDEAAAELRRMHDLLGKANALCRIRAEEIERLKAQPEQEPVAWVHHLTFKNLNSFERSRYSTTLAKKQTDACCIPLYTNPPQRTWVGLTNDEVNDFAAGCNLGNSVQGAIYRAEAKLKEKNT